MLEGPPDRIIDRLKTRYQFTDQQTRGQDQEQQQDQNERNARGGPAHHEALQTEDQQVPDAREHMSVPSSCGRIDRQKMGRIFGCWLALRPSEFDGLTVT